MPDHLTSYISISEPIIFRELSDTTSTDLTKQIEALEAANFELRNQITGLKLHNTTLRRMLAHRRSRTPGSTESPPGR
jgi:ribosomal protein L29